MKKFIILLVGMSLILSSCSSKKAVTGKRPLDSRTSKDGPIVVDKEVVNPNEVIVDTPKRIDTQLYINQFAVIAKEEMEIYKIPASITLAQAVLESNSGNSELTRKSNNHFGIKCHQKWTGERVYHDDDENDECFRVYKEASSSFKDHSEFLNGRRRYSFLFKYDKGDYVSWAKGLRQAGYATDNQYPQKLIRIIEKYQLYKYDKEVLGDTYDNESKNTQSKKKKKGETLYQISKMYSVPIARLKRMNHLSSNTVMVGQRIVLRSDDTPSMDAVSGYEVVEVMSQPEIILANQDGTPYHIVKQGESLFGISRKYKLSIRKMKKYNHLTSNEISIGQKLYLQQVDASVIADANEVNDEVIEEDVLVEEVVEDVTTVNPFNEETVEVMEEPEVEVKKGDELPMKSIPKSSTPPDFHIVKKGETLYAIAYKYNLEIPMFRKINNLKSDSVRIGQVLKLRKGAKLPNTVEETVKPQRIEIGKHTHTVIKGDTLYSIATRNLLSVDRLKYLNHLTSNKILIGQVLVLE